ncbi:hypothetical protein WN944_010255 [Citrus x changshan-huyou]|uniref:Reverse transcriptase n=1 Tax=Citrus x changshan-huyou TaxID=2935761 RepID=A0AAP0MTS5_9ROSI
MALKLDIKKLYDRLEWDFLAKADVFGKLKEAFQLEVVSHPEKYLSLPSMLGRSNYQNFSELKEKINKPDLPLTSGDVSMRTGIAIASSSLLVSLAMGIMLRSPPLLLALIIWFLLASAYSVDKYVLGRQIAITRTLMFAVAIKCCFCFVISLLKDIPDEDGDREFGIQTPSVILGKESVLWLCVYVLLISYGAVIIVGLTSSPYLLSKLVMAGTVDLSSKASTLSFYMFIWKLHFVQYLVLPFVRL